MVNKLSYLTMSPSVLLCIYFILRKIDFVYLIMNLAQGSLLGIVFNIAMVSLAFSWHYYTVYALILSFIVNLAQGSPGWNYI